MKPPENVLLIDFGASDVRSILDQILSCERIASSSLHGLILADAYGIPNAWIRAEAAMGGSRPCGGEYKYYDYFSSVNKYRNSQDLVVTGDISGADSLEYDGRAIEFDYRTYLDTCPFLKRMDTAQS